MHARDVVTAESFTAFGDRPPRLRLFLDAYGWTGRIPELLDTVTTRLEAHIAGLQALAAEDLVFAHLLDAGVADTLNRALAEIDADRVTLASADYHAPTPGNRRLQPRLTASLHGPASRSRFDEGQGVLRVLVTA